MIIAKLQGGMGNQMFQYAFGRYLADKHKTTLKLDTHFLLDRTPRKDFFVFRNYDLDIFDIDVEFASVAEIKQLTHRVPFDSVNRIVRKVVGRKPTHIYEHYFHFSEEAFNAGPDAYLEGYWQSEKYFEPIREKIKKDFTVKQPLSSQAQELASTIESSNAVCINIRRGDFVISTRHNVCNADYYMQAEKIMLEKVENPHFFVFSDEIEWCKSNLSFSVPTTFVGHEYAGPKFQDYFRLISLCKNFIIPNSSFAWWAVYLSKNADKIVIAPKHWFNDASMNTTDLVPADWIRINTLAEVDTANV